MLGEIFRFECRHQIGSPLFIATALIFFVFAFLGMASEQVNIGDTVDNVNLNAPYTIVETHFVLSIVAMFAAVAFVAFVLLEMHQRLPLLDLTLVRRAAADARYRVEDAGNVRRDRSRALAIPVRSHRRRFPVRAAQRLCRGVGDARRHVYAVARSATHCAARSSPILVLGVGRDAAESVHRR